MSRNLTHAELVDLFAAEADISKKEADQFIKTFAKEAKSALITSGKISLSGVGTFKLQWVKQRKGKHPKFGTDINIPTHYKIKYNVAKRFGELLNRTYSDEKMIVIGEGSQTPLPTTSPVSRASDQSLSPALHSGVQDDSSQSVKKPPAKEKPKHDLKEEICEPPDNKIPKVGSSGVPSMKAPSLPSQPWFQLLLGLLILIPVLFLIGNFWNQREKISVPKSVESPPVSVNETSEAIRNVNEGQPEIFLASLQSLSVQQTYTTAQGDWFYKLSEKFYQRTDAWIFLFAHNDYVPHPDSLLPNTRLEIPDISTLPESQYDAFLSQAYFVAYQRCRAIDPNLARVYLLKANRLSDGSILKQNRNTISISDAAYVQLFQ